MSNKVNNTIIAGPCALEEGEVNFQIAQRLRDECVHLGFEYIFKASFDKANRLSISSGRGIGINAAVEIFGEIKRSLGVSVTTDVHDLTQVEKVASAVDVLQIPAFLARQTDLIIEAARTGKIVNIKKAQFMTWSDAILAAEKAKNSGAKNVWLTERGSMYGYRDLVVDFRNIYELLKEDFSFFLDATHSVQRPGANLTASGGDRQYVPTLVAAAGACGVTNLFFETHPDPNQSISDGPNMIPLDSAREILIDFRNVLNYRASNPLPLVR